MGQQVNRVEPLLPAHARKTYAISRPKSTHWRPARCAEVDCSNYRHGWWSKIDETTELGQRQAYYIRKQSGKSFTEEKLPDGLTQFTFPAGQECFAVGEHQALVEREPLFVVLDGDHRGNPRRTRPLIHTSAEAWRDDFGEHQQTIADAIARG